MTSRMKPAAGLLFVVLLAATGASAEGARPKPTPKPPAALARTLDDIHIEGEIAVPQVLFITARDQRRFLDFQHRRYLKTCRELGETTVFPTRIALIQNPGIEARKEISR